MSREESLKKSDGQRLEWKIIFNVSVFFCSYKFVPTVYFFPDSSVASWHVALINRSLLPQ